MNFTIVSAPNGLGHIFRMLELAKLLVKNDSLVQLIAPSYAKIIIGKHISDTSVTLTYIDWDTPNLSSHSESLIYSEKACSQAKNKYLISDNLTEVLLFRHKVLLSANFFWSDQDGFGCAGRQITETALIHRKGAKVVCNKFFMSKKVSSLEKTIPLKFFMNDRFRYKKYDEKSLLISFGVSGRESKEEMSDIVRQILGASYSRFVRVYLEPKLFEFLDKEAVSDKFKIAQFDRNMFEDVTDAVIRPGLGTIQNLLSSGVRIFPIMIAKNHEIEFNCDVIEKIGVGKVVNLSNFVQTISENEQLSYKADDFFMAEREVLNVFNDPKNYTQL
jgi:hypothetical protein